MSDEKVVHTGVHPDKVPEMMKKLAEPFDPTEIRWRAGSSSEKNGQVRAMALAYIEARAAMDRLDSAVGSGNWRDEYLPGPSGEGIVCGVSIFIGGEWVTKWDGAENTDFESVKGGLSDAFKRACVKWGIGRYLYRFPAAWVDATKKGRAIIIDAPPPFPEWGLPEGYEAPKSDAPKRRVKKTEAAEEPGKTSADLLVYAKAWGFDQKSMGAILVKAGIKKFDPALWDKMIAAIDAEGKAIKEEEPQAEPA
jgi:hypothetical protein